MEKDQELLGKKNPSKEEHETSAGHVLHVLSHRNKHRTVGAHFLD
jgi:hypothetical protein